MFEIIYVKDGRQAAHNVSFNSINDALRAAHELTRDRVADFTRVRRVAA